MSIGARLFTLLAMTVCYYPRWGGVLALVIAALYLPAYSVIAFALVIGLTFEATENLFCEMATAMFAWAIRRSQARKRA